MLHLIIDCCVHIHVVLSFMNMNYCIMNIVTMTRFGCISDSVLWISAMTLLKDNRFKM
jgi:hypothetical protein